MLIIMLSGLINNIYWLINIFLYSDLQNRVQYTESWLVVQHIKSVLKSTDMGISSWLYQIYNPCKYRSYQWNKLMMSVWIGLINLLWLSINVYIWLLIKLAEGKLWKLFYLRDINLHMWDINSQFWEECHNCKIVKTVW